MPTSPGASVGAKQCPTHAVKASPLIGPSSTIGATMRSWRNPARRVSLFQCPCGTCAVSLAPLAAQPRVGVVLVLMQVQKG